MFSIAGHQKVYKRSTAELKVGTVDWHYCHILTYPMSCSGSVMIPMDPDGAYYGHSPGSRLMINTFVFLIPATRHPDSQVNNNAQLDREMV